MSIKSVMKVHEQAIEKQGLCISCSRKVCHRSVCVQKPDQDFYGQLILLENQQIILARRVSIKCNDANNSTCTESCKAHLPSSCLFFLWLLCSTSWWRYTSAVWQAYIWIWLHIDLLYKVMQPETMLDIVAICWLPQIELLILPLVMDYITKMS